MANVIDLSPFNTILQRLEGVAVRLESAAGVQASASSGDSSAAAPQGSADSAVAVAFDTFMAVHASKVEAAAKDVNPEVVGATANFLAILKLLRALFTASDKCAKPNNEDWSKILAPMIDISNSASKACDNRSDYFSHCKAVAECTQVMMLPTQPSTSAHVQQCLESMDFHGNKVLMKKIPADTAWVRALKETMKELVEWCKENIKLGLSWKAGGQPSSEYFAANPLGTSTAEQAGKGGKGKGGSPPAPKGGFTAPPKELFEGMSKPKGAGGGGGMADVFSQLQVGTSGLKAVTADMKTKNRDPNDKVSVVQSKAPAAAAAPRASLFKPKGPRGEPKMELERGFNWMVENQEGGMHTLSDDVEQSHLVCIINCKNTTIKIDKKVKNVCLDGCMKVSVLVHDVVSAVEFVNSDRCVVQTMGKVNSFAIDKCDGAMVHLSKESVDAEFTTAKSSEMNITMPDPSGVDGDIIEMPIPEQFVSKINLSTKKLETRVSDLYTS